MADDDLKIHLSRMDRAMMQFDDENNVEPPRRIAERIASKYGANGTHSLVDDISHALEDAYNLGVQRGIYHS